MSIATITSKGQTTIPKAVRDRLRLKAGDRVEFVVQDDGSVLPVPRTTHLGDLRGLLPRPTRSLDLDEIDAALRRRAAERHLAARR